MALAEANKLSDNIEKSVNETIHRAIVEFEPDHPGSYERHSSQLRDLEAQANSLEAASLKGTLLSRIRAQLVTMAYVAGDLKEADRLTALILNETPKEDPDFLTAVLFRVQTLHRLERHEDEIQQAQSYSSMEEIEGEALAHLLSHLVREHPGKVLWTESIKHRLFKVLTSTPSLSKDISLEEFANQSGEAQVLYLSRMISKFAGDQTARALNEPKKL